MKETTGFEDKLKRLEDIASELQKDEVNLEKAIELYKEGTALSKECYEYLGNVEQQIFKAE